MKPCDPILRVPADFLREARRLFGRLRPPPGPAGNAFPIEVSGGFDGITLAACDGRCRLETFRSATMEAGGSGCLALYRQLMADACRADPGTVVELAACRQPPGTVLRLCRGGVWHESRHPPAGRRLPPAPALPDGERLRLPARTMEALATVAPFADWDAAGGWWRRGVCFSPAAGGRLIAGNIRRLACLPAQVPPPGFVLPLGAVRVLLHPDFLGYENAVSLSLPGAPQRVMFRAWGHQLVAPVLPPGPWEDDVRLRPDAMPGWQALLDGVECERLLGWLRALRDPRAPVTLESRSGGVLEVHQGPDCATQVWLEPPATRRVPPPAAWPRIVLPPRDLAAALQFGGRLGLSVSRGGRIALACQGPGGAICVVASLARTALGGSRGLRGSGRRPAA